MKFKRFTAMSFSIVMVISLTTTAFAQENTVLYHNDNLLTSNEAIMAYAVEDSISSMAYDAEEDQLYYEDGKFYEFESIEQKSLNQKVNTLRNTENEIVTNYVQDVILSGTLTSYDVLPNAQNQFENNTYYPRAAVVQTTNEGVSQDPDALRIRLTTNYSVINNCISIGDTYGKVVSAATGSGVSPQNMVFEAHVLHGGVYNSSGVKVGNQGKFDNSSGNITGISVGESYYKQYQIGNISNFYYVNGDAYYASVTMKVTASRGVSATVTNNIKAAGGF